MDVLDSRTSELAIEPAPLGPRESAPPFDEIPMETHLFSMGDRTRLFLIGAGVSLSVGLAFALGSVDGTAPEEELPKGRLCRRRDLSGATRPSVTFGRRLTANVSWP